MEIVEDSEEQIKCYKCKEKLYGSLNIIQKDFEETFLLWNKYQIFLYEHFNFETVAKVIIPDFQIKQLIVSNNYLVCVDCNGNVHTASLKFKNTGQKRFKSSFQPRERGILRCIKYSSDYTLSLKASLDSYFLCLHKINAEFNIEKETALTIEDKDRSLHTPEEKTCILSSHSISEEEFMNISQIFKENVWKFHSLVVISFDKHTVYACMFSQKSPDEVMSLKKLYTSPAEICDIVITEKKGVEVFIGLTCGTLARLVLNNDVTTPEIIHMNTALSKLMLLNSDSMIYSDCMTLWKAENIKSKENINHEQFIVREVKDFVKYNGMLICTTFTNLIYKFSVESDTSYVKQDKNTYCPAEKVLKNSDYLSQINQEIEKNKEIIKKINDEQNNLTIVSLSRRQDVMEKFIQENVIVFENYLDICNNSEITLTEELENYLRPDVIMILVKITTSTFQHSLSHILSNILENLKIHVTLTTEGNVVKTTTVKLSEPLKKLQILIPTKRKSISQMNVEIQLVSETPVALDTKNTIWNILHRKNITLNAEHFIKTNKTATKNKCLKEAKNTIEELICKNAENLHGELFKFTNINSSSNNENDLSFYVKPPVNYREVLKGVKIFNKRFNNQKATFIQNCVTSEDFLKSKCNIFFEVGTEKVYLEIINDDFSSPLLKVSCKIMMTAFHIRNFFASVFYQDKELPEAMFISNALYTTTENLQRELKNCCSSEDCFLLAERLQKTVIAALPM